MHRHHWIALAVCLSLPASLFGQSAVPKSNPTKVYAHYMPWFQSSYTLGANNWGWHWKMNTRNPNVVNLNGQRQIASHYYPLIGPYDSSDPDVIEYHMLLMKVAGIDGVIVDWYGQKGTNGDVGSLLNASNKIINKTSTYGMKFAVMLEDRFAATTADAKANVDYARANYFNKPEYIRAGANNAPLLPVFGPVKYHQPSEWTTITSGAGEQPAVLPLWYQSQEVGTPAKGEQAWIYQDSGTTNHLTHQANFLKTRANQVGVAMGAAYPGFNDYYQEGGAGSSILDIPSNNGQTLSSLLTLDKQYAANIDMLQLTTFNDFGEGTMFEPTVETGFTYLQQVQQFTGVPYGLTELQMVYQLYDTRKKLVGNTKGLALLDTAAADINSLDFAGARSSIDLALIRLNPHAGDASYDGKVSFDDLVIVAQHYNLTSGQSWETGDFTKDGVVEFADLVILAQNYGYGEPSIMGAPAYFASDWALAQSFVPEPATLSLAFAASAGACRRHRPSRTARSRS